MHARSTAAWHFSALVALLALVVGCNGNANREDISSNPKSKRLVILINGDSSYWDAAREGMKEGAKKYELEKAGLSIFMEPNDNTPKGQIDKLRQYASQPDIVGVAVSPVDANNVAIADEMQALQDKGVQVIAIDGDLSREQFRGSRKYYIGTDNLQAGRMLGTAAKNLIPDGGGFVDFVGRTGAQNAIERMDGVKEAVGDKFQELDRMGDDGDRGKAQENVRNALRNFPDLKMLVGIWSYNAPAIADVVQEMNKRDQVKVLTFDAEKLAIEQMAAGNIDVMIVQNPYNMGYQSARLLKAMVQKDEATIKEMFPHAGEPDGDLYDTGLKLVVPPTSPLRAEMFNKNTEFLQLDAFKKWLAQYDLDST